MIKFTGESDTLYSRCLSSYLLYDAIHSDTILIKTLKIKIRAAEISN